MKMKKSVRAPFSLRRTRPDLRGASQPGRPGHARWRLGFLALLLLCLVASPFLSLGQTHRAYAASAVNLTAPGFDTCTPPSTSQMATWWQSSPYRWANIYVGGESAGCKPSTDGLNASWVQTVLNQGWDVLPTWVGLQAPCYTKTASYMSSDTSTSYQQGKADADSAAAAMASLGMGAGSVVYDDIEAYSTSNSSCVQAVSSFVNGWDQELAAQGYVSGLYESASTIPPC